MYPHPADTPHPLDELAHHAGPAAVGLRRSIKTILHQLNPEGEPEEVGQLSQQVHTEALITVVALEVSVVGATHHIWVLLQEWEEQVRSRRSRSSSRGAAVEGAAAVTRMVVTIKVLFIKVSEELRSREEEFRTRELLENQVPT